MNVNFCLHPTNTLHQLTADLDDLNAQLNFMMTAHPGKHVILSGDFNPISGRGGGGITSFQINFFYCIIEN